MASANQDEHSQPGPRFVAGVIGLAAALITATAVSWATPDGNLVVTSVPALVMGLIAYGLAAWRLRLRG